MLMLQYIIVKHNIERSLCASYRVQYNGTVVYYEIFYIFIFIQPDATLLYCIRTYAFYAIYCRCFFLSLLRSSHLLFTTLFSSAEMHFVVSAHSSLSTYFIVSLLILRKLRDLEAVLNN